MSSTSSIKDRIRAEYSTLLDNFTNLLKASKLRDQADSQSGVPGDMLEVFVEKMLAACSALLAITGDLKGNALLNDVEGRNREVELRKSEPWQEPGEEEDEDTAVAMDAEGILEQGDGGGEEML